MHQIVLHEGREKSVLRRHPWIFSRAIEKEDSSLKAGDLVQVISHKGQFLGWGFYSPASQIRVRLVSFDHAATLDRDFVKKRLTQAVALRKPLMERGNDGVRLVASEGDFMPGLVVDKYNDFLVLAITSQAMEAWREHIVSVLQELFPECSLYERSDGKARLKEELPERCGVISGVEPPDIIYVKENNLFAMPVDIKHGHKTGGYLDQRESRRKAYTLSKGATVLNCFSYTGGFGLAALKGGAVQVENVDVSELALKHAKDGVLFNHLDPGRCRFLKKDVFAYLREQVEKGVKYDLVILDPPKFAESVSNLKKACRGYQDINRLGLMLTKAGGRLLTFSCSGLIDQALFQKIVADAAVEAGVQGQVVSALRQDEDHVVSLPCPESFYLKGLEIAVGDVL